MDVSAAAAHARVGPSEHLADLLGEVDDLAARIRDASETERIQLGSDRSEAAILATLRLDGSPIEALPDLEGVAGDPVTSDAAPARATWLDAMRALEDEPDERLQALEVLGTRAGLGSDDLARSLPTATRAALEELHRRLTHGLVADERAGRPRELDQAVHDASTGRILYFASDPARIDDELAHLEAWVHAEASRVHPVVVSGVLHLEVLRIHPFDAANGRLARVAARLMLRASGLDPDGLACPEPELAADSLGYYEEVARTARRRDATIWMERWAEAVAAGLRTSAARLGVLDRSVPEELRERLDRLDGPVVTVGDYRDLVDGGTEQARAELRRLVAAGLLLRLPGSRGLRFRLASTSA
jgi:Fic family protein